ncbi:pirin family protein [Aeromonas piscicola]|uniref:pirin family protein n=1 Tax=Aeromonas piscicola TaxID=600645 RepID=UPI0005B53875|nr:pirin family protein [Aeromonas piscicola]
MKKILGVYSAPRPHWVGDGFPVRSLFSYSSHGKQLSPFLLLDYAGPANFTPSTQPRGVGQHPHRGFETVTIVYKGEVAHRDSTGQGGVIGPGDVQWMTAGAGILHEEFHAPAFSESGGELEMVQLWVNLPSQHKMTPPGYQAIFGRDIPTVALAKGTGTVRVIAGEFDGHRGPARTFSPLHVWDLRLVQVNGSTIAREAQMVVLDRAGRQVMIEANSEAVVLLLSGEPIEEPIVGHGPFVMNSHEEIVQAIDDFNSGRFGLMSE